MRRNTWSRVISATMAVWLTVSLSAPAFLHSCPTHDAGVGVHSSTHTLAAHSGHHLGADSSAPKHDGGQGHHCTCIGSCCCAAPIALNARFASLAIGESATLGNAGLPAYSYVPVAAEHLLPFQNGPPAAI